MGGGGHAGHNGLKSIESHVGPDFSRIRLGVGHPGDKAKVAHYVLRDFAKSDRIWVNKVISAVGEYFHMLVEENYSAFMHNVTTTVNTSTVAIEDSLLKLAKNNSGNAIDFGVYGQFNDGAAKFSGIYRDTTDGFFKLFTGLTTEPSTTVSAYGTNNAARANLVEIGNLLMGSTDIYVCL